MQMILYKYCRPGQLEVLQTNRIRFTPPALFNDPFEANPSIPDIDSAVLAKLKAYQATVAGVPNEEERQALIDKWMLEHFVNEAILKECAWTIGTLCLSEPNDSLLMWAHYAAEHTGFAIGIDVSHESWVAEEKRLHGATTQVTYADERPHRETAGEVTASDVWYTKSTHWAYEREWRATRLLRTALEVKGKGNSAIHLFECQKEAIREVIVGYRADDRLGSEIQQILAERKYPDCQLLKAVPDKRHFKLNIQPYWDE
jgi:hypothetical protein